MAKPFLIAEWRKLILANYEIDPKVLEPYLPVGTELDFWQKKCYVSLVGFMFLNTTVKGIKVPGHVNFEEVNLRFYVKRTDESGEVKRGVVFIKEIVPKPMITFVANKLFKEHYETLAMNHLWEEKENTRTVKYVWYKENRENSISVEADKEAQEMLSNSKEFFITEHYWGYSKGKNNTSNEYEVKHPIWQVYPVKKAVINVDYGLTYGDEFEFLNHHQPASVMLAEGSEISVGNKRIIS
ncbi:MAG: DUF2071 domain-containing protein [Vicingaceae bacterium]|nr:DUF2071 domain-containing protein [Vicingaceae bacterium]